MARKRILPPGPGSLTLARLVHELMMAIVKDPALAGLPVNIEHRMFEDDNPDGVGIYHQLDRVGLSFWKD